MGSSVNMQYKSAEFLIEPIQANSIKMPHQAIWVNADATQVVKSVPGGYKPPKGDLLLKTISVAVNPGDFK